MEDTHDEKKKKELKRDVRNLITLFYWIIYILHYIEKTTIPTHFGGMSLAAKVN